MSIPLRPSSSTNSSFAMSPTFLKNSWAAPSMSRSNLRWDWPPLPCLDGTRDWMLEIVSTCFPLSHPRVASLRSMAIRP